MSKSLRSRLLLRIALTTIVVLSTTSVTTFVLVRRSLQREFDSLLGSMAEAMTKLVEQEHGRVKIEFTEHRMEAFVRKVRPEYYEVWNADGVAIARSPHLGTNDLMSKPDIPDDTYSFIQLPDGRRGRLVAERFFPLHDEESPAVSRTASNEHSKQLDLESNAARLRQMTLAVACGTEEIDGTVNQLAWMIFIASTAALVILIGALAWTVSHALRPLESLASQIGDVSEHSLSTRIDLSGAPAEVLPVVERTNCLMQRLEQAFLHERTFAADVAHELRTPLAGLRSTIQVALSRPRKSSEYSDALRESERICTNVQRLVETLLSLAQVELNTWRAEWEYIDVKLLIDNVWTVFEEASRTNQLQVTRRGPDNLFLNTDADKIRVVLCNLFDNAVAYSNRGGAIDVHWNVSETTLTLKVSNTGCQLKPDQISNVFDRFWRGDPARANTGVHAGLGLALCRKIINALNGSINAACRDDTFEITLVFNRDCVEMADDSTADVQALTFA